MKKSIIIALTLIGLLLWPATLLPNAPKPATVSPLRIGIISYWDLDSPAWDRLPANSLVLINPDDGILKPNTNEAVANASEWVHLFHCLKRKNVVVLGYVPTGYFDHVSCKKQPKEKCQTEARIRHQVETYYRLIPSLDGIFYDETSSPNEDSADYGKEYELLRSKNHSGRLTVFNPGSPSQKAVNATKPGEHLVLFESSPDRYDDQTEATLLDAATSKAHKNNIIVWHLLHSVPDTAAMCSYVAKMAKRGADYGYVTNITGNDGDPTWNTLPPYWDEELAAFTVPDKPCVKQ